MVNIKMGGNVGEGEELELSLLGIYMVQTTWRKDLAVASKTENICPITQQSHS